MKAIRGLKYVFVFVIFSGLFFVVGSGCQQGELQQLNNNLAEVQSDVKTVTDAIGDTTYGPDETLNLLRALQSGNAASAPFNPYALPIGAGLSGIIAVLEALRRKEKGSRKFAEYKLSNGSATNGK